MLPHVHRVVKQPADVDKTVFDHAIEEEVPGVFPLARDVKRSSVTSHFRPMLCRRSNRIGRDVCQRVANQPLVSLVLTRSKLPHRVREDLLDISHRAA